MDPKVAAGFTKAGIASASRHCFVCLGPDCCPLEEGEALWEYVKLRVRETGIPVMRTKVGCFRICSGGPWIVVYPEGVWYGVMTPTRFEKVLAEHLLAGVPIEEWIVARNDLRGAVPSAAD